MQIYLCPSPELYHLYHHPNAVVVIVDIFRATTTITTALYNGARGVMPVSTVEEALLAGEQGGYLVAAERNVARCATASLGNDPLEYTPQRINRKEIVMTTTNGTRALRLAQELGAKDILIGSFLNLRATIDYCQQQATQEVVILGAGWQGQMSTEDCIYAGAWSAIMEAEHTGKAYGDACLMMRDLWNTYCQSEDERIDYLKRSEHYARLVKAGYADAVAYCLRLDTHPIVIALDAQGRWLRSID